MINGPETTIGIFLDGEKTNMISIAGLLAKINLGEAEFSKEDYFRTTGTKTTELVKFRYDPFSGKQIMWDELYKRAVEERMVHEMMTVCVKPEL